MNIINFINTYFNVIVVAFMVLGIIVFTTIKAKELWKLRWIKNYIVQIKDTLIDCEMSLNELYNRSVKISDHICDVNNYLKGLGVTSTNTHMAVSKIRDDMSSIEAYTEDYTYTVKERLDNLITIRKDINSILNTAEKIRKVQKMMSKGSD